LLEAKSVVRRAFAFQDANEKSGLGARQEGNMKSSYFYGNLKRGDEKDEI
jgi:hypothetical protein